MKLTRYEQEVVINLNADEDEATVYTANPTMDMELKFYEKWISCVRSFQR